jgi:anti-sigma factor RsiW
MTDPHIAPAELEAFAAADLPAGDLARVDRHLASCPSCAQALGNLTRSHASGLLAAVDAERRRHLTFEEIEAIVDGGQDRLDGLARTHLDTCESCRLEVEDLRGFAAAVRHEALAPAAAAAPTPAASLMAAAMAWMRAHAQMLSLGGAVALIALLVSLPTTRSTLFPGGGAGGSSAASLQAARDSLSAVQIELQLPDDRVERLRQILAGTGAPGPGRAPTEADRALLARAERAYPAFPLVLGALAQDLGLVADADRFYRQALEARPGAPDIQRLIDGLPRR